MVGFNINLTQIGLTDVERSFLTVGSTFWKQFRLKKKKKRKEDDLTICSVGSPSHKLICPVVASDFLGSGCQTKNTEASHLTD